MDRGFLVPDTRAVDGPEIAERADDLGYDSVWIPELWGDDALVRLTDFAHRLDCDLGTAIVNVYSRSPAVLAAAASTLDDVAPGRVTLGLGVSTPKAIEDLHGMAFERPARRGHETIELIERFTAGEGRVDYDGELFDVQDFPARSADVPIYYAALGPANRRVVGRLADGWIPHNVPFRRLDVAFETVAEAAEEAGRDPDDITVAPYVPCAVSEDPAAARDAIRGHVAYYVGSGEGYRKAVAAAFPEAADAVADAWRSGDREAAADAVTDEMVDALGVAGTPERARERLRDLVAETAIDYPILVVPAQAAGELAEPTMEALAPE
ncbi:LLM class flavin-dependent oxidoreductase [Halobacteriales archaeon QS_1_68_20]|nr:MAG: LLM class flavin-dependent oxidoreductase [Halobacteriales archaeon QS_1_68_20]